MYSKHCVKYENIRCMYSKKAVGNSWDILNAILSHLYHLNQLIKQLHI